MRSNLLITCGFCFFLSARFNVYRAKQTLFSVAKYPQFDMTCQYVALWILALLCYHFSYCELQNLPLVIPAEAGIQVSPLYSGFPLSRE